MEPTEHLSNSMIQIRDIQDVLGPEARDNEDPCPSTFSNSPNGVLDMVQPLTLEDVCSSLPSKAVVDKLIETYLNTKYVYNRK